MMGGQIGGTPPRICSVLFFLITWLRPYLTGQWQLFPIAERFPWQRRGAGREPRVLELLRYAACQSGDADGSLLM